MNQISNNLTLRWSFGSQDTTNLDSLEEQKYQDMIWLTKLSVLSFQNWFDADFVLLYNGKNFVDFQSRFNSTYPILSKPVLILNQPDHFENPYNFIPLGVWNKWVPFRLDKNKTEISIDTDIICLNHPKTWMDWVSNNVPILVAPERFEKVLINTCGDFANHPLLKNKTPCNCGVVGIKAGYDLSDEFYNITKNVKYGETHNSMFITEQGAINLWIRVLETEGTKFEILDFKKNAWMRDFLYFLSSGVKVETLHAVSWGKKIVVALKDVFEDRICNKNYDELDFMKNILDKSQKFDIFARHLIARQILAKNMSIEFLKP